MSSDEGKDGITPSAISKDRKTDFEKAYAAASRVQRTLNGADSSSFRIRYIENITKGYEKVNISLEDEVGKEGFPKFNYISQNIIYRNAKVIFSLARIGDEDCCADCRGDCLASPTPCACACKTRGKFAYTEGGLLTEEFLAARIGDKLDYCEGECPLEKRKNESKLATCKGHHVKHFIQECWTKCGCNMGCGNRVVQRGISCKLQVVEVPPQNQLAMGRVAQLLISTCKVFKASGGKGWGVRTLEVLPKGAFVCEYVGEILTNAELYDRNENNKGEKHSYPVLLDADWQLDLTLDDETALCLDATYHGNVARFMNHRCEDGNLVDIPVQVETSDRRYYHLAFFTTRIVEAFEELTWDYGLDFDDVNHPVEAFRCNCGSKLCRDRKRKGKKKRTRN